MPDRDEWDWDLGGLYDIGHLEVNIAPWKGSVRCQRADEPAVAEIYLECDGAVEALMRHCVGLRVTCSGAETDFGGASGFC
jgi:hypothetical protein